MAVVWHCGVLPSSRWRLWVPATHGPSPLQSRYRVCCSKLWADCRQAVGCLVQRVGRARFRGWKGWVSLGGNRMSPDGMPCDSSQSYASKIAAVGPSRQHWLPASLPERKKEKNVYFSFKGCMISPLPSHAAGPTMAEDGRG